MNKKNASKGNQKNSTFICLLFTITNPPTSQVWKKKPLCMKHQKKTKTTKGKISLFFVAIKNDFLFFIFKEEKKQFFFWLVVMCVTHLLSVLTLLPLLFTWAS
jgi:hypothetical protein